MDPGMNQLLKWSIENSDASLNDPTTSTAPKAERPSGQGLNAEAIKSLMGGPSDADLMRQSMAAIESPDISLEHKLVAFDNFEQLIENIDNANNIQPLGLWTPLKEQLSHGDAEMRRMAAWCMGTAVQNNPPSQERLLAVDAIPVLVKLALKDPNEQVRRKAVYALSSEIRNYPPALNVLAEELPQELRPSKAVNAGDMEEIDTVVAAIRTASSNNAS